MLDRLLSIKAFLGINNVEDDLRLAPRRGAMFLKEAANVDIDDTGAVYSRKAPTKILDGTFSSLWSDGLVMYGIRNGNVFKYDFNEIVEYGPVTRTDVDFCKIAGKVFFTGDTYIGRLTESGVEYPQPEKPVEYSSGKVALLTKEFNSQGSDSLTRVTFYGMETGDFCIGYKARLLCAKGNSLVMSSPFDYLYTSAYNYFLFDDVITALASTENFVFVGTDNGAYTLTGENADWKLAKISDAKVYKRSAIAVSSQLFGVQDASSTGNRLVLFAQPKGVFIANAANAELFTPHYWLGGESYSKAYLKVANNSSFPFYQYCLETEG